MEEGTRVYEHIYKIGDVEFRVLAKDRDEALGKLKLFIWNTDDDVRGIQIAVDDEVLNKCEPEVSQEEYYL